MPAGPQPAAGTGIGGAAEAADAAPRVGSFRQLLPYAGLLTGLWAAVAPYALLGRDLNAEGIVEVIDHVVPGLLVILLSVAMVVRGRRARATGGAFPLLAGLGVALAGLWMTATHLPLVSDARRDLVSGGVAAWHTSPGLVVLVLGGVWAAAHWAEAGADDPSSVLGEQAGERAGQA